MKAIAGDKYSISILYVENEQSIREGYTKAYHVNVSRIKHKNRDSYLLSLTDITKMNIEKIHTEKKPIMMV
ncbi:MAG TPA: hypothetical protein EYH01_09670 [Campylobacterales bacterium]|nr:hypothetical protein [Campylobacterales bacterium]